MKYAFAVLMTAGLLAAAEPQATKKKAAAPAPAAPVKRLEVPAGAVERDGRYYYTDADGKKWIYVRTPFGASRMEDKPDAAPATKPAEPFANVKITESGDTVTFERPSPFGTAKWQKKKSELTDEEKAALLRRTQEGGARPAAKGSEVTAKQDR